MSDRTRRAFIGVPVTPGERVALDPDESHHVSRVLRLKAGDALTLFDGRGGEWDATVASVSPHGVGVAVSEARTPNVEAPLRVVVHQAIVRPEKLEWVLQKGTEIGIAAFRLIPAERAGLPPPSPSRMTRYGRIVLEACKQSGRVRLPEIAEGSVATPGDGVLAIALAPGAAPLAAWLTGPPPKEVWLAAGPEGGFTQDELDVFAAQGWRLASLGPRVLRTETAGCIAAAIVLHTWADLGR